MGRDLLADEAIYACGCHAQRDEAGRWVVDRPCVQHDPLLGPCARCGELYAEHPGGFCPDQVAVDGLVLVEGAEVYQPCDDTQPTSPGGHTAQNAGR
jgi:hypothetical protein